RSRGGRSHWFSRRAGGGGVHRSVLAPLGLARGPAACPEAEAGNDRVVVEREDWHGHLADKTIDVLLVGVRAEVAGFASRGVVGEQVNVAGVPVIDRLNALHLCGHSGEVTGSRLVNHALARDGGVSPE